MKNFYRIAFIASLVALATALAVPTVFAQGALTNLTPEQQAARSRAIAQARTTANQLTVFDREGKVLYTVGQRDFYQQPSLSPDGNRIVVIKQDPEKETADAWVIDVATSKGIQITSSQPREFVSAPVWSPDGTQIAYVGLRSGSYSLYRKRTDGTGAEELVYKHPGAPIILTDWSLDGRFLTFSSSDLSGGMLYALPLTGDDRKPIVVSRSEKTIQAPRVSPDSKFMAYRSDETGKFEVFVTTLSTNASEPARKWQISDQGGLGMVSWRRDGREFYYFAGDRGIMAVSVTTAPDFEFGKPKMLFRAPGSIPVTGTPGGLGAVSRDGQRAVFAVPTPPPTRQITLFDREGKVVGKVGETGLYNQPSFSPDGTKLAVLKNDQAAGIQDIWVIDIASGKSTRITNDAPPENNPLWSPDGKYILYVANRPPYSAIYRRPSDGSGAEEMLFRYTPGAFLNLTDVSPDGNSVIFGSGGVVFVVPLTGSDPLAREAIEFSREEYDVFNGRLSPDARSMAYVSNEVNNRGEIFIRPFDAAKGTSAGEQKWQVTKDGADGGLVWRSDSREMYYGKGELATGDVLVYGVDITSAPTFQAGTPKLLFRLPQSLQPNSGQKYVSRDGQRFVFVVTTTPGQ
jgi:Tol biopolymer transport system component